jgi:hypothetical protein
VGRPGHSIETAGRVLQRVLHLAQWQLSEGNVRWTRAKIWVETHNCIACQATQTACAQQQQHRYSLRYLGSHSTYYACPRPKQGKKRTLWPWSFTRLEAHHAYICAFDKARRPARNPGPCPGTSAAVMGCSTCHRMESSCIMMWESESIHLYGRRTVLVNCEDAQRRSQFVVWIKGASRAHMRQE